MDLYEYSLSEKANIDNFIKANLDKIKVKKGLKEVLKYSKQFGYHIKLAILCRNTKPFSLLAPVIAELTKNHIPYFFVDSFYYISSLLNKNFKSSVGIICSDSKLTDENNILPKLLEINDQ